MFFLINMYKSVWNEHVLLCSLPSGSEKASNTSPVSKVLHHIGRPVPTSQWKACLSSFIFVAVDLCTPLLALITNVVVLLMGPQCFHSHKSCRHLIYLDPALTVLGGLVLTVAALPQVSLWEGQIGWFEKYIHVGHIYRSYIQTCCFCCVSSRWRGTDCCCYRPHLHTFVYLISHRGLQAFQGCRVCTTSMSGSYLNLLLWPLCTCTAMPAFQHTGKVEKFDFCTGGSNFLYHAHWEYNSFFLSL